jgi:hypothetical protein
MQPASPERPTWATSRSSTSIGVQRISQQDDARATFAAVTIGEDLMTLT